MFNKIIVVFLLTWAVSTVQAQEIQLNPDHPDSYVVVKGDTLWDISGRFLQEPWRWPEIWEINPQIENPHLIYPGDVVSLRFTADGQPVLSVDRDSGDTGTMEDTAAAAPMPANRNVKLSPEIREYTRDDAIHSIPVDAIRHMLSRPLILTDAEIEDLPYVVAGKGHLLSGKFDRVFVRGMGNGNEGVDYSVYRKGDEYVSNGELLGYEAIHIADVVVLEDGDPATIMVTDSKQEIRVGDRLVMQSEKEISSNFIPTTPQRNVNGSIIDAVNAVLEIGRYQVVVVDRGARDGVEIGNVLGIFQSGKVVQDKVINQKTTGLNDTRLMKYLGQFKHADEEVTLPEDLAGVMMVFRTFDRISYGLVMEAYAPMNVHDTVKNL